MANTTIILKGPVPPDDGTAPAPQNTNRNPLVGSAAFLGRQPIAQTTTTPGAPGDKEVILDTIQGYAQFYGVPDVFRTGTTLVTVTNLNNTGAGSLRDALGGTNKRWIRFSQNLGGTIQLSSSLSWRSNVLIDGRGANITVRGPDGGSASIIEARAPDQDFGAMYIKWVGSATVNPLENDDGCSHENTTGTIAGSSSAMERFFYLNCEFSRSEDEVFTCIRSRGKFTVQSCRLVNNDQVDASESHEQVVLMSHGSNGNNYGWEQFNMEASFYRNYWEGGDRMPFITIPSRVHSWNNYRRFTSGAGHFLTSDVSHITSRYNAAADSARVLSESETYNGSRTHWKPTLSSAIDGCLRTSDQRFLGGASNNPDRLPGLVPNAPYSYTLESTSAALDTSIINTAGWQSVPFPGD